MYTLEEMLRLREERLGKDHPEVQMLRNQIIAEQSGKNFRELYSELTELVEPVDPSIRDTSAEDMPQPNSLLNGRNVKTSSIDDRSQQLVGDIMNSQEKKDPLLSAKQSRLLEILKNNQALAEKSDKK
ncbi:hypothetical protein MCEMSE6_02714 [Oxalobacteraceae bacterium]